MKKTIACIIARTNSTRLKKKVLINIKNKMLIEHIINKLKKARNIDEIYLCTSIDPDDEILLKIAEKNKIKSYAGSRDVIVDRMLNVAKIENATDLVRVTGDNIYCDEIFIDKMIELHNKYNADYTRTAKLPIGVTAEIFSVNGLKNMYNNIDPKQSEYLTYYVFFRKNNLKILVLIPPKMFQKPFYSLTVDTPEDLERTLFIVDNIDNPKSIYLDDIIALHERNPIPFLEVDKNLVIKFPDNMKKSYSDYLIELEEKYKNCIIVELEEDFYEKNKIK